MYLLLEREVHVRCTAEDAEVQINLHVAGQMRTLNRPKDEVVGKGLTRLQKTLEKKRKKTTKKGDKTSKQQRVDGDQQQQQQHHHQQQEQEAEHQGIWVRGADGNAIDQSVLDETLNVDFWVDGMELNVFDEFFVVRVNPPSLTAISPYPRKPLLQGYEAVVTPDETEFADGVHFTWLREVQEGGYVEVADGTLVYAPTAEDVGKKMQVQGTPYRDTELGRVFGRSSSFFFLDLVQTAPPPKMLSVREDFCKQEVSADGFRVMSYNILADAYANSEFSHTKLYSYVHPDHLDTQYRSQLSFGEIMGHNPDIVCLQECDRKVFRQYLGPLAQHHGMDAFYLNKCGGVLEGSAILTRSSKFLVLQVIPVELKKVIRAWAALDPLFEARPGLQDVVGGKVTTVAHIVILRPVKHPNRRVVVANTHLFYHPAAQYVRMIQLHVISRIVQGLKERLKLQLPICVGTTTVHSEHDCAVWNASNEHHVDDLLSLLEQTATDGLPAEEDMFFVPKSQSLEDKLEVAVQEGIAQVSTIITGDLNNTPEDGGILLLGTGLISPDFHEWRTVDEFKWGSNFFKDDEVFEIEEKGDVVDSPDAKQESSLSAIVPVLSHDLGLFCATASTPFTNFAGSFVDVLDYIFADTETLTLTRAAEMPPREVCAENVALPSPVFPSDHLSICVDLAFVDSGRK